MNKDKLDGFSFFYNLTNCFSSRPLQVLVVTGGIEDLIKRIKLTGKTRSYEFYRKCFWDKVIDKILIGYSRKASM